MQEYLKSLSHYKWIKFPTTSASRCIDSVGQRLVKRNDHCLVVRILGAFFRVGNGGNFQGAVITLRWEVINIDADAEKLLFNFIRHFVDKISHCKTVPFVVSSVVVVSSSRGRGAYYFYVGNNTTF